MNRPGKKSFLNRAKRVKASPKSPANAQGNSALAKKTTKAKSKGVKPKAIANSPRSKQNSTEKSTVHARNSLQNVKSKTSKSPGTLKLAIYLLTITIGLSTIFGSLVAMANSFQTAETPTSKEPTSKVTENRDNKAKLDSLLAIATLGKEITPLKSQLTQLASQYPDLTPEIFLVDLDNKGFVNIGSKGALPAASTIKLPILVAFFQDVDQGKINLEEELIMTKDVIASGSGGMQYEPPNSKFSALKTAEEMMTTSDNTATNMLIKRLGGKEKLNQEFIRMGLAATIIHNPLPDLIGTNTTSSADLGNLLVKIDGGSLISLRSRDRLLYIMRNIVRNTLLPQGLEPGALIAHKTGDIKSVLGDVGIIDMPNGKRYIASVLVKRPDNSPQAKEFIQKASSTVYQYFKQSQTTSFTVDVKP